MTVEAPRFPELLALDLHRFRDFARDRDIRRGISWFRSGRIVSFAEEEDGLVAVFDGGVRDEPRGTLTLMPPEMPDGPPVFACSHVEGEWSEEEQWGTSGPDPSDTRLVSAEALWGAGQGALALRLMVEAHLDAAAAALGVRLPGGDDTWRWIYAEALPAGALTGERANALALALAAVRMGEAAPATQVEEAWGLVRRA